MFNNLSIYLPTKNRQIFLNNCLKSFVKLNLKKSQVVVIDQSTGIKELVNGKFTQSEQMAKIINHNNIKYIHVSEKYDHYQKLKLYIKYSRNYKYFGIMSDDDFFINNDGINKCIDLLNSRNDISFAITSTTFFQDKPFFSRKCLVGNNIIDGSEFLKRFCTIEAYQQATCSGIFRIKNLISTDSMNFLDKIKKNNLNQGYGIDTRIYFRNATVGKVACLGEYNSRAVRFHDKGMTFQNPIESSYVYYWNIAHNINYCQKKNINIPEFKIYLASMLLSTLKAHLTSIFFNADQKIKMKLIYKIIRKDFMLYLKEQLLFHKIELNKEFNLYFKLYQIAKLIPDFLIIKKNDHYSPNSIIQLLIRTFPTYYIKKLLIRIFPTHYIKKLLIRIFPTYYIKK
jgi:hypothetical protein